MQRYSATVMDHFETPRNLGAMESPDAVGYASVGGRAPFVRMCLRIAEGTIADVMFQAMGCGATIAAASCLTEIVKERPIAECERVTADTLIFALEGLPDDKAFCARVAIAALRDAIRQYLSGEKSVDF